MRIDQLPVASSATNLNTLPLNIDGVTEQISVGNLSNAIRDDVYGAPLTASTSAGMTDQTKVYVYTGTTGGGYTNGHWYYYNGSAWTDGGAYNSSAVTTDTTLTLTGVPADAKATGTAFSNAANVVNNNQCGVVSAYTANPQPYMISAGNKWITATASHYMFPVAPGDVVQIRASVSQPSHYSVLKSFDVPAANATPDFSTATGFTARVTVAKETTAVFTAPADAAYIAMTYMYGGNNYAPESVQINGVEMLLGVRSHIANLQNRQSIFQSLSLQVIKTVESYFDNAGHKYQAQSLAVTDDYVVIGMNSVNTTQFPSAYDKYNAYLVLDKTTLEPASLTPNPVLFDFENGGYSVSSCHAGNMSYVAASNELWIRTTVNHTALVLDADTLAYKQIADIPLGAFAYDNETAKWFFLYDDTNTSKYSIRIYDSTRTTVLNRYTVWKQGTTQGGAFHDNAVFIPNTWASSGDYHGNSLMMVDASTGSLLADWWFPDSNEFEDLDFMDNQVMQLISTPSGCAIAVGAYKPYNQNPSNILSYLNPWNSTITALS